MTGGVIARARARLARPRLTDAVIVAAAAMLILKLVSLLAGSPLPEPPTRAPEPFARVLAHARTNYVTPDPATTGSTNAPPVETRPAEAASAASQRPTGPASVASPSERALLERLGERREELQQRGRDLETRTRLLENAERRLEGRLHELRGLEERGEATAARRGDTEAGALKNLVVMYEAMKPKEAARVFERLPHDVLVPVVTGMNPRKMAEVLAAMSPEAAERLTVSLAGRAKSLGGTGAPVPPPLPSTELPSIDAPAPAPRAGR